jgi:hypothetical protein
MPAAAIANNARCQIRDRRGEEPIPTIIGAPAPEPEAVKTRISPYFRGSGRPSMMNVQPLLFGAVFFSAFLMI